MKQVVSCTDHNKRKHSVEMFFKAIFNPIFGDRRGERERERERGARSFEMFSLS
jgi:hypothetical protein